MWKQSVGDKRIVTSRAINESQDSEKKDLGVRGEGLRRAAEKLFI